MWADLLSECAEELNVDLNKIDLYSLAQYYANEYSDSDLRSIINNKINRIPQESNLLLNSLLEIGFNSIWTTNYDNSMDYYGCVQEVFTTKALDEIHKASAGIPRMIKYVVEHEMLGTIAT